MPIAKKEEGRPPKKKREAWWANKPNMLELREGHVTPLVLASKKPLVPSNAYNNKL